MPGRVPGTHVFFLSKIKDVDGRAKPGQGVIVGGDWYQSVNPTSTTATAAAPTSATFSGSTLQPFSWLWNQYQSAVATPIQNQINYVQQQAAGQIDGLAILILIIAGYLLFYGNLSMREAWSKMLRFLFVLPLVTDPSVYNAWVVEPVNGIVTWLAQGLGVTGGASGPASLFGEHKNPWGWSRRVLGIGNVVVCQAGIPSLE